MFLGGAILVPISEVGSVASATGWLSACAAYFWMQPSRRERLVAAFGVLICVGMILMKFLPVVPGHFSVYEWIVLITWSLIGIALGIRQWMVKGATTLRPKLPTKVFGDTK